MVQLLDCSVYIVFVALKYFCQVLNVQSSQFKSEFISVLEVSLLFKDVHYCVCTGAFYLICTTFYWSDRPYYLSTCLRDFFSQFESV